MQLFGSLAALSLASIALATPHQLIEQQARDYPASACAQVASSVALQTAATPTVPAQLAYDCITSVPLNKSAALVLINDIKPYYRWQSTITFLKNPPPEYVEKIQPPVDVWGELAEIQHKVETGIFTQEWEFGNALYTLQQSTHDGHFVYIPDVVGTVFNWARPVPLVSVSADGKELPKPFVYPDILAQGLGNISYTPSAICKINGQEATSWLEDWAQHGSLQDRDALYNNVFYELAAVSIGPNGASIGTFAGSGRGRWVYPGPDTTLEFENGTTVKYTNFARVLVPFNNITDGESLYKTFFTYPKPAPPPTNTTTPPPPATPTPAPGYPPPVFREIHNEIGSYYLTGDYSEVAVLSVPSFVLVDGTQTDFQAVAVDFLAAAKAAGKKKLIVDLQINGGGTILTGYDLYKLLFPDGIGHAAGDRFRASQATDLIGQKFSQVSEGLPRTLDQSNATLAELEEDVVSSNFNYQTDLTEESTNFKSWKEKFGPDEIQNDYFSSLFRWNLSDVLTPYNSGGIYVHGYGPLANYTQHPQPFAPEDIVVITDGYCASTCTIFSELMRVRGGVKYIALGGRARPGIIQAIGGVKGTNDLPWDYIQSLVQETYYLATPEEQAYYNTTELNDYYSTVPFDRAAIGSAYNVNFRDGYKDNTTTPYPLQFQYETADCRILYTPEMTYDVTAIWKAAADSAWGTDSKCIAGSASTGSGWSTKRSTPRASRKDAALERRHQQWKRSLKVSDYPMDIYTHLDEKIHAHGFMFP